MDLVLFHILVEFEGNALEFFVDVGQCIEHSETEFDLVILKLGAEHGDESLELGNHRA